MKKIDVEKIIFNGFETIVFWNDGTKTIVSMSQEERNFDPEDAFRAAYTKKMYGTNSKIKRVIKEKSNIEQHQRIVEEKLKEELAKISQDYDKFMRKLCPWLYTGEKLTEVDSACANAISDFYKVETESGMRLVHPGAIQFVDEENQQLHWMNEHEKKRKEKSDESSLD